MVDMLEAMLKMFLRALRSDDRKLLAELLNMEIAIDHLRSAAKHHVTANSRG
ncbi:MAG: PhoU domain-containing protein [Hyphomicrobiaceae bacterium]